MESMGGAVTRAAAWLRERFLSKSLIYQIQHLPPFEFAGEFCNDAAGNEWHSLALGLTSTLDREPFDPNLIPESYPASVKTYILEEYHYYRFGRWTGRLLLLVLVLVVTGNATGLI